jgi:AAA-like domain
MACLRGCLAWMVRTTGRREFRGRSKVVIVPEVHLLTKTPDGASFLDYIARVGRALGASLVLDTQDPASILKLPGLVEQITTLFAFSLRSREQVDSLLELLGRPQTPPYQALVRGINTAANGKSIRHGHCIMRDRWDEVATVQIDIPSQQVAELLRTTPTSEHDVQDTQAIPAPYEEPDPFAPDFEDEQIAAAEAAASAASQNGTVQQPVGPGPAGQDWVASSNGAQPVAAESPAGQLPATGQPGESATASENNFDRRHAPRYDAPIGPDEVYDQEADEAAYNEAMYSGDEVSADRSEGTPDERQRQGAGKKEHVA